MGLIASITVAATFNPTLLGGGGGGGIYAPTAMYLLISSSTHTSALKKLDFSQS